MFKGIDWLVDNLFIVQYSSLHTNPMSVLGGNEC